MMKNEVLTFRTKELFNDKELHQYDEDGQKGFLGYLLRYEQWEIKENQIVFPGITNKEKINELLEDYSRDIKITNLRIRRGTLNTVDIIGKEAYKKQIDEELKQLSKKGKHKHMER